MIIRRNILVLYLATICFATASLMLPAAAKAAPGVNEDQRLEKFKKLFLNYYWRINPVDAIYTGYHRYDSLLVVPDAKFFNFQRTTLKMLGDSLKTYEVTKLSPNMRTDYYLMRDKVESMLWYINEYRDYEWNPASYNVGGEFAEILNSRFEKLDARLRILLSRMKNIDAYYRAAMANIKNPVIEHTDLAILQNEGSLDVFGQQLEDSLKVSGLSLSEKKMFRERMGLAKESISTYIEYLKNIRKNLTVDNSRSFRLGKELYDAKFRFDIRSGYTAEQIYKKALERKEELLVNMAVVSRQLWSKYMGDAPIPDEDKSMIRTIIEKVSETHVHRDSFIQAIEKQIPELVAFVNDKNLLYLDPTKPLVVRKTPPYMEGGGAGASISSPGPYDPGGNTYYNVSLLTDYTPEKAESYLREYNHYMLQILNIHEAIPGHYAQLVYANKSPSLIKSILGNGAMIEGWAVYSERMMLEEGYGKDAPEMWLMYYKWHLRSVCNTILDYSVHVNGWSEKVAVKFLTDDAFQQAAEAEGKWRRVKLTQVQLCSYFTGYTEIYDLREELKAKMGKEFDLRKFHEKFLSYGSAPVPYIRELMLNDLK